MTCPQCHAETPGTAATCPQCGAALHGARDEAETMVGVATPPPPSTEPAPAQSQPSSITPQPELAASQVSRFARPSFGSSLGLEAGEDFGPRYRIESLIGEGGMGKVYKAYDKELERIVALKLVRPELASDPASMKRFKQELLLASRISHKNILRIHDLGDVEGNKFISMTYVEGEDLWDVIKREGRFPLDRAITMMKRLCSALEAAHAEGVVHRDLKPRNILVDGADNVYISDFGLAKSLEDTASAMTRTGEILGTPRYMSPEQAAALPADHQSDLYSLGLIFYEMVTGDVPFHGAPLQMMNQRLHETPKSPQVLVPELPDYVTAIIMRCLEKDLARRYHSAREILQDLEAGTASPTPAGTPATAVAATAAVPVKTPVSRRVWLIGAVALAMALAMAVPQVRNVVLKRAPAGQKGTPAQDKYMAILPFRVGDDAKLKYQADGVEESLSAKLFQLKSVHLASAAAVQNASKQDSIDKVAHELGVALVLQGTVQGAGDKINIALTLQDVPGKKLLWSQEFSGLSQDLLTIQDQIYTKLVGALDLKLDNEEMARGAARPTEDIGAYDVYLRAHSLVQTKKDEKTIRAALDLYDQAVKKDPSFALAYAGMSAADIDMYDATKDGTWAEKSLGAAQQAQRLNDNLPEAHLALGGIYIKTGKSAEAIAELKRALEFSPNSDQVYRRLGNAYAAVGRKAEAITAFQKAVQANPYYWLNSNALGIAFARFGDYEKSISAFKQVLQLNPQNGDAYTNLGAAYFSIGKWDQSAQAYQKSLQLKPSALVYSNLGLSYLYRNDYANAINMLQKGVDLSPNDPLFVGNLADGYRDSGQTEKALPLYDRAISLAFKAFQVNPKDVRNLEYLAMYYAKKSDRSRALEYVGRARAINANDGGVAYVEAVVQAITGNQADALKSLREALQKGYAEAQAATDPDLKPLRSNPEFDKLMREFGGKAG